MNLIIDNREQEIKKYFKDYSNINFENLDLGDIRFDYNGELILLIERKTLKDLAISIKSGRYREQKFRLLNSDLDKNKILYLIEGNLDSKKVIDNIKYDTFMGSFINLLIRDNLKTFQTSNLDETLYFLKSIYTKLSKNNLKINILKENYDINQDYLSTIKSKKKENITPNNCYILQLSQIPGISTYIASQLAMKYNSFKDLYKIFDDQDKLALKDLTYQTTTGKSIRFGEKKSIIIYNYINNVNI